MFSSFVLLFFSLCVRCIEKWKTQKNFMDERKRKHVKATTRNLECDFLINDLYSFFGVSFFFENFNNKVSKPNWNGVVRKFGQSLWHTFAATKKLDSSMSQDQINKFPPLQSSSVNHRGNLFFSVGRSMYSVVYTIDVTWSLINHNIKLRQIHKK